LTTWHCILSAELTKTRSFRLFFGDFWYHGERKRGKEIWRWLTFDCSSSSSRRNLSLASCSRSSPVPDTDVWKALKRDESSWT